MLLLLFGLCFLDEKKMIKLYLGNIGSGKSAIAVREMSKEQASGKITFSNILTKHIKNVKVLNHDMIIKKEVIGVKKNGEEITKQVFNKEYWQNLSKNPDGYNIIIDEAHMIFSARASGSIQNRVMSVFMSMLRRVLGRSDAGYGTLILISQLIRSVDVVGREMVNQVQYHICHYKKTCKNCNATWHETNEIEESIFKCPRCGNYKIIKHSHIIQVLRFRNMIDFMDWKEAGMKTYFKRFYVTDIEDYFGCYDTLQWDNLISE